MGARSTPVTTHLTSAATRLRHQRRGHLRASDVSGAGQHRGDGRADHHRHGAGGQTLTAVTTGIMDANGLTSPTYTYQWIRVDGTEADIAAANSSTYILVAADLGTTLKVRVTFADDLGHTETLTSAATATVTAAPRYTNPSLTASRRAALADRAGRAAPVGVAHHRARRR